MSRESNRQKVRDARGRLARGSIVPAANAPDLLLAVLSPGQRVILEGDNQKQASFLARTLSGLDPKQIHGLHMLMSAVELDDHIALFERGIARRLDFAFSGPQAAALARLVRERKIEIGAVHTYLELYSRYLTDLRPDVALLAGEAADPGGNVYLGCNAEETPFLCEATRGAGGATVIQVERVLPAIPRVDIPSDRIDFVVEAGERPHIQPLFTRDPARITPSQILMGMMTIRGIYEPYAVQAINHGIGYATAAIELLLPTYAASFGLRGRICSHWILNPHPTLIPAVEAGFVRSIYAFGSEPGMQDYIAARRDVFFTSDDGVLLSSRPYAQVAGHYAVDCFAGATLQLDGDGNSSTATFGRIAGFGGAPNLGSSPPGRRHASPAWTLAGGESAAAAGTAGLSRGRKLVVQITPTLSEKKAIPVFVDELDAVGLCREYGLHAPPVMLYGDDITHIVTERGIAALVRCSSLAERRAAIRAVAGDTPIGRRAVAHETEELRRRKVVLTPEDLGIAAADAIPDLLAAGSMNDLVRISGGLYRPPAGFRAD